MKKEKNNIKGKKYKMTKRTCLILLILIVVSLVIFLITYTNSEKYQKQKMKKTISKWAEEYYTQELVPVASEYIKSKAKNDELITINLDALKKIGKDTDTIKNTKTGIKCDDIGTYVYIRVDKDANDIKKEYTVEKVVLDCFN